MCKRLTPYSTAQREEVIDFALSTNSHRASTKFGVSYMTVQRWLAQFKQAGHEIDNILRSNHASTSYL